MIYRSIAPFDKDIHSSDSVPSDESNHNDFDIDPNDLLDVRHELQISDKFLNEDEIFEVSAVFAVLTPSGLLLYDHKLRRLQRISFLNFCRENLLS